MIVDQSTIMMLGSGATVAADRHRLGAAYGCPVDPGAQGRCSVIAAEIGEDPAGSAPSAVAWAALLVPGRWAGDPLGAVDATVRRALANAEVGLVAVRPTGDSGTSAVPGLLLAGTRPGRTWRRDTPADDAPAVVGRLAAPEVLDRLSRGEDPGLGRISREPAVLVAAHGDPCSADRGPAAARAIAASVTARRPGGLLGTRPTSVTVLEASDLGPGRFAPTALLLPWGVALGGLGPDPDALARAVQDAFDGRPLVDGYRGRSTYPVHVQVAEAAARRHLAVVGTNAGADDMFVDGVDTVGSRVAAPVGAWSDDASGDMPVDTEYLVRLRHSGGRTIRVTVRQERTDVVRPPSCGDGPEPVTGWVTEVDADPPTQLWWGPADGQ